MQSDVRKEALVEVDEPPECGTVQSSLHTPAPGASGATLQQLRASSAWNDWRWQMQNRIRTLPQLLGFFPELARHNEIQNVMAKYPMAITPYYASLIRHPDMSDPVFQMSVPQVDELYDPPFLSADPLEEDQHMPVPGLIRRYPDRALVLATTTCSMYCRHCTRKRMAGMQEQALGSRQMDDIVRFLTNNPEIRDVIVSGGDPLTLPVDVLDRILTAIRSVKSVDIIRVGTRTPVVMPQRITDELTGMLKRHHPLWMNTHFNHPVELTPEAAAACRRLADAGIPLGNQTVLLRGVNDETAVLETLCRGLIKMRVRPYYLFQCDLVRGIEHFRTPVRRGIEIMASLRGRLSGLAIPTYIVDAPCGAGKIPVLPNYIVSTDSTRTVFRNGDGLEVTYPEPACGAPDSAPSP